MATEPERTDGDAGEPARDLAPKGARDWLDLVLDPGRDELFDGIVGGDPLGFPGYAAQLEGARARTGCSESVVVSAGAIDGIKVIAFAFEFGFLGGSMGVAAGERIARAFEVAAHDDVPVIGLTASGGARMQEGMLALAQMPATLAARARLAEAHRPFLAYLRNPTTGGVFASFASSADMIWAEPRATIGFAGPRVAETFTGAPLPEGSHTAEAALRAGLIDRIVRPAELREMLHATLAWLAEPREPAARAQPAQPPPASQTAWEQVLVARDPARPASIAQTLPLRAGYEGAVHAGIARIAGSTVMLVGLSGTAYDAHRRYTRRSVAAADYRFARHAIAVATRLRVPIVTTIDTPGADPSAASEAEGVAREISATFDALRDAAVPTVACVTGEGGSGGALALAACDRVIIQQNAFFSVIAPEGAASILKRDDVDRVAGDLRLTAHDLVRNGLADLVVEESPGGAQSDPETARALLHEAIGWALGDIAATGGPSRAARDRRWRAPGAAL